MWGSLRFFLSQLMYVEKLPGPYMALKRFDTLILPIFLCGSEVWNHIRGITVSFGIKLKLKELIHSLLKGFLEFVNITTRNVGDELGRYLLTLTLKQWILSNMKETFRKDYDLFWSDKIMQTNELLTYCMYKNDIIE